MDEELRRLAEGQMKRLNTIHDVLTDPVQRRKYDLSLAEDAGGSNRVVPIIVTPAGEHSRKLPSWLGSGRGLWVLTALIGAGALCWYFLNPPVRSASPYPGSPSPPESKPGVAEPSSSMPSPAPRAARGLREQTTPTKELIELRRQLQAALAERDAARAQLATLQATEPVEPLQSEVAGPERCQAPEAGALLDPFAQSRPAPEEPRATTGGRFAGTWFYVRPKVLPPSQSLYPPDYIETVIVEEEGVLRGRYRARYQVADRAISPEVRFRFEGEANESTANLVWTGAGGARGNLCLRLISANSLEVRWTAAELGTQMGLAAGTAVLIRRHEP